MTAVPPSSGPSIGEVGQGLHEQAMEVVVFVIGAPAVSTPPVWNPVGTTLGRRWTPNPGAGSRELMTASVSSTRTFPPTTSPARAVEPGVSGVLEEGRVVLEDVAYVEKVVVAPVHVDPKGPPGQAPS